MHSPTPYSSRQKAAIHTTCCIISRRKGRIASTICRRLSWSERTGNGHHNGEAPNTNVRRSITLPEGFRLQQARAAPDTWAPDTTRGQGRMGSAAAAILARCATTTEAETRGRNWQEA